MQWTLRDAEEADAEGMMLVHLSCIQNTCSHYYSPDQVKRWSLSQSTEGYAAFVRNGDHCIVAEDKDTGNIVAFGCMGKSSDGDYSARCNFELRKLYVAPTASRRGLGKLVFCELEKKVLNEGGFGIGVISSLNAAPFYKSRGFFVTVEHALANVGQTLLECKHLEKWFD